MIYIDTKQHSSTPHFLFYLFFLFFVFEFESESVIAFVIESESVIESAFAYEINVDFINFNVDFYNFNTDLLVFNVDFSEIT